jgi:beta-glucosidase
VPKSRIILCFPVTLALLSGTVAASQTRDEVRKRVDDLLGRMTLEEKIGQLTQLGGVAFRPGAPKPEDAVRQGNAGSILWLSDPAAINRLQKVAMEESRLHIPLLFGLDVVHGFKTIFPMPLAMAASWDMGLIERVQTVAAREARAAGIAWTFAPMVDIARDPRWGRLIEGAGEDPYLGAAIARAQVRGFQGNDIASRDRVLACAKHFAGYGAAEGGRDYDSTYIPESQLWNVYLPPFHAALEAGVGTFMAAYQDLNDIPATGNRFLLQDVLRKTWNFQGFVVSDANSVADLTTHGFARDPSDAAFRALTAGVNMDMASTTYLKNLGALVKQGRVSVELIDASVRPILAVKIRLGLFEHPYVDEKRAAEVAGTPAHRELARAAGAQSAVLLRNEGPLLPLPKDARKSIGVIGPLGDSQRDMLTMWAGFGVDTSKVVTLLQGIRSKLGPQARVEYAPGVQIRKKFTAIFDSMMGGGPVEPWTQEKAKAEFESALDLARRSDLVVMALGELNRMSAEAASQSSLELPGRQRDLLDAVLATGKPVVLVLINGRPLNITWAADRVPAILEVWHSGQEGGHAIADLLFGDASPSGKLPITWPRDGGQIPIYYAHNRTHVADDSPMMESRYWDQSGKPLFPFGYGLSYTTFAVSDLQVKQAEVKRGGTVELTVQVKNTGSRAGSEVVQLYIHQKAGGASRPVRELKGFERVALESGQTKQVRFVLGPDQLKYWNSQERTWVQDAEAFDVWAGTDSNAGLHGEFKVVQ